MPLELYGYHFISTSRCLLTVCRLLRMGMKRRLTKEDIWNLATEEEAEYLEGQLTKHWRKETSKYT